MINAFSPFEWSLVLNFILRKDINAGLTKWKKKKEKKRYPRQLEIYWKTSNMVCYYCKISQGLSIYLQMTFITQIHKKTFIQYSHWSLRSIQKYLSQAQLFSSSLSNDLWCFCILIYGWILSLVEIKLNIHYSLKTDGLLKLHTENLPLALGICSI